MSRAQSVISIVLISLILLGACHIFAQNLGNERDIYAQNLGNNRDIYAQNLGNEQKIYSPGLNDQLQQEYARKMSYKRTVYNKTLDFIRQNPDSPGLAGLYFNLAEMSTEIDVNEPWKTVQYYKKVIELEPDFYEKDVVYYNIGYYGFASEVNKRDEARMQNIDLVVNWPDYLRISEAQLEYVIKAYREVLENSPHSIYNTEAAYRLGMVYFNIALDARILSGYFDKAIQYFDIVASREGDPLQHHGLFQRAWTYFASANFTQAIKDFTEILEIIYDDSLETERPFFEADAIENMAFSLIEYDGTDFEKYSLAAEMAKQLFRNFISDAYGQDVILAAVDLKKIYNAPMQAIDLYNAYIDIYPASKINPCLVDSIMTLFKQNPSRTRDGMPAEDLVIGQMARLVVDFRPESVWYQANKDKDIAAELQIIKDAYEFLEPRFYNKFAQSKQESDYLAYEELVNNYSIYAASFDELARDNNLQMRKNVVSFSQDMAEGSQDPKFYFDSIVDIENFIKANPDHPDLYYYKDTEFYNYEQIYKILSPTIAQQAYVDSSRGIYLTKDDLDSLFIYAAIDFELFLVDFARQGYDVNDQIIKLIYDRAELRYERGDIDAAYNDYYSLLNYELDADLQKITYARLAEISQEKNNLDDAELFYREAASFASAEEKASLSNNVLATMQLKATTYTDSADYITAAEQYLKLAEELRAAKPAESISYILKAIENYEKAGEFQIAIDLYLEIAARKTSKADILAAYLGAWTISDKLQNWPQSEKLRYDFISLYPTSQEAYKLQLQIIGFYEGEQFNDKLLAAQMLEVLHDEASQFDLGEDRPEDILLQALKIYQELKLEDKIIELCLKFERLYPNHEKANDFLVLVARMYNERGDTAKFAELTAHIYEKDPSIDLYVQVAADKLKEIKAEVDDLFETQQYTEMLARIDDFNEAERRYLKQNVVLPTEAIHETFSYYQNFVTFQNTYRARLDRVRLDFLDLTPATLIKVNNLTEWKKQLVDGENRINVLMQKCDAIKAEMIDLIQQGNEYQLATKARTEAIYLAGKVYDYGAEVVITQVQKFLDVSNQLNNAAMRQNPVQQQQYKTALKNNSLEMANEFRKKAAQMYQTLLAGFYDEKDYSDQWTELALNRLIEWGVRKGKIFDQYFSNKNWQQNLVQIESLKQAVQNAAYWQNSETILEAYAFESAEAIVVPGGGAVYYKTQFSAPIKPELLLIEYAYDRPLKIFINDELVEKAPVLQNDFVDIVGILTSHYNVSTPKNLQAGKNTLVFEIEQETSNLENSVLAVHYSVQYDEEGLEFTSATEQRQLLSDFSWVAAKAPSAQAISADTVNQTETAGISYGDWKPAGPANFEFFKKQMFGLEDSQAEEIWYAEIDTNRVDTVFLQKVFKIEGEVLEATAQYFAQNIVSIWINGQLIVEAQPYVEDQKLKKVLSNEIAVNQLNSGLNTIVVKVVGEDYYKGFIFELDYTIRP